MFGRRTTRLRVTEMLKLLKYREDFWPDNDLPKERYLYVTHIDDESESGHTRIEIFSNGVWADDTDITFDSKERLNEWIYILRKAWKIKVEQDKIGWLEME